MFFRIKVVGTPVHHGLVTNSGKTMLMIADTAFILVLRRICEPVKRDFEANVQKVLSDGSEPLRTRFEHRTGFSRRVRKPVGLRNSDVESIWWVDDTVVGARALHAPNT